MLPVRRSNWAGVWPSGSGPGCGTSAARAPTFRPHSGFSLRVPSVPWLGGADESGVEERAPGGGAGDAVGVEVVGTLERLDHLLGDGPVGAVDAGRDEPVRDPD